MSRRGYSFERETETWLCQVAEQDLKAEFITRSFRTATSGAALASKGDVRMHNVPWLPTLVVECKHLNDYSSKGPTFHLYADWVEKIYQESVSSRGVPALTWAFKHVRTNRGEGRVQFLIPTKELFSWITHVNSRCKIVEDQVKYVDKKNKYFLVYHDQLWKEAVDPAVVTLFNLTFPTIPEDRNKWSIISRRHLQLVLTAVRTQWKNRQGDNHAKS